MIKMLTNLIKSLSFRVFSSNVTRQLNIDTGLRCLSTNPNKGQLLPSNSRPLLSLPSSSNSLLLKNLENVCQYLIPNRGMKVKARIRRRCKGCILTWVDGLLYNYCKLYPRHNQRQKPKYYENERIITWTCRTPKRPF